MGGTTGPQLRPGNEDEAKVNVPVKQATDMNPLQRTRGRRYQWEAQALQRPHHHHHRALWDGVCVSIYPPVCLGQGKGGGNDSRGIRR